ncbi:RNA polymerase sigma factor SigJ [Streptomyces beijiangensis]|uniref:RNA polymerase sigma factor SigJ n=1 Tax=Streptomyces beijiangensis TaxID=163361 RepID=A0A939F9F6_9ACTN|nr:RNA polymerase sigma factor SigJ [Streptomyces beijiangensis]MBO0513372.1 RNA polymerase sigma factor SigJ [Streptomyces beijiangensis]
MDEKNLLAERFEENRTHLRAVAYRMLGSIAEAEDAVQESWFRADRTDLSSVQNLPGWLTTVVGRVCLDMLRTRKALREDLLDTHVPDPVVSRLDAPAVDPEQEVLQADAVGLALLVVLETLPPAERLAFVLHDMFAVPFDDIAPIVDRTPATTRQLASRARHKVEGSAPSPDPDQTRQREVVEAFMAAARGGDFEALVSVLDPDIVFRVDAGSDPDALSKLVRGATTVASGAITFSRHAPHARLVLINGAVGLFTAVDGRPVSVMSFTVADGRVAEINLISDPDRLPAITASLHLTD